jgi:DNA-binding response OmpR family regulator
MKILLVEDDPGIGRFVSRGLTAEGFVVEWLQAGQNTERRLRTGAFSAAIIDLGLPDIEGSVLCAAIRRTGIDTPILMLTARDSLEDKLEGFRSGADDYLCKPFAFEELLARLRAIIRRRDVADDLLLGDLQIDPRSRVVAFAGERVVLTPREYAVLLCLARASPDAVGRQEILDQVWGQSADITENTVDVYVGYLRRRFTVSSESFRIETVRGFGFRIPNPGEREIE